MRSASQPEVARSLRMHPMLAAFAGAGVLSLLLFFLWLEKLFHLQHSHARLLLSLALPASLASGIFAAVLARLLDPRVYLASDVARVLGIPPLVTLPGPTGVSEDVRDESVLRLAAAVEALHRRTGARTLSFVPISVEMDTGPLVQSLQRKLAQMGFLVRVAATTDIFPAAGDPSRTSRKLHHTAGEPLESTVPESTVPESTVMEALRQAKSNFDFVLLTLAPLIASAQTEYLAACTDATVLVAECHLTREDELAHAFERLLALHVVSISVVLDGVEVRFADQRLRRSIAAFGQQQANSLRFSAESIPLHPFSSQRKVAPAPISAEPAASSPSAAHFERSPLHARGAAATWEHFDLEAARDHSLVGSPAASHSPHAHGSALDSQRAALPPEKITLAGTSEPGRFPQRPHREEHQTPAPAAFTTARWLPIPTLRSASLPWRERASSPPGVRHNMPSSEPPLLSIQGTNDQALDPVVRQGRSRLLEDFVEPATIANAEEPMSVGKPPELLATAFDSSISRRWGLLSRLEQAKRLAPFEPQETSDSQAYSQESHNPKTKNS